MAKSVEEYAAEPMKYFSHDSNASTDMKCQRLIMRRGYDGYGRWWRLCEHMALINGHKVAFKTDEDKLILGQVLGFGSAGFDMYLTIEETTSFINDLLEIGLLSKTQNEELLNNRMLENAMYFGRRRHSGGQRKKKKDNP